MLDVIQTLAITALAGIVIYKLKPNTASSGKSRAVILDSCALIDGRVIELARAGFVPDRLIVPQFILAELQLLADGSDSHKRERARFGLEIVQQLQKEPSVHVELSHIRIDAKTTDEKLVKLAKKIGADLFTTDFNLNQVASIEGVRVLNINELSHAMRPVALPGEDFELLVVQAGSNRDQGVGYLEDGTMVVVDNARRDIGSKVTVKVTKTHQTVAGKMLFGVKVGGRDAAPAKKPLTSQISKPQTARAMQPQRAQKPASKPPQKVNTNTRQSRPVITRANQPRRRNAEASLLNAIEEQDK